MAVQALTAMYVELNSSASINDHVKKASLTVDVANLDSTAMGDTWTEATAGVKSGTLSIEFNDDFATGSVDAFLWPLLGTVVGFKIRANDSAVGVSNPSYFGNVLIAGHAVGGAHGELAMKALEFPTSGTITRSTTQ
jgi:hypothetical protein